MELLLIIFLGLFCCCVGNICIKSIKNKRQPGININNTPAVMNHSMAFYPGSVAIPVNIANDDCNYDCDYNCNDYDNLPAYETTENTNNTIYNDNDLPKYSEI